MQNRRMRVVGIFRVQVHRSEERRLVQNTRATGVALEENVDAAMDGVRTRWDPVVATADALMIKGVRVREVGIPPSEEHVQEGVRHNVLLITMSQFRARRGIPRHRSGAVW